MTREQAKTIIRRNLIGMKPNHIHETDEDVEYRSALLMAISALEQEPNRDAEEIAEIIKSDADAETKCKMISNILTAKPHYFELSQEPCDDVISREAVNGLQRYRYTCGEKSITCVSLASINELPSVQPSKPCDSCKHWEDRCTWLPSRKGHWEDIEINVLDAGYRISRCRCSECKSIESRVVNEPGNFEHFKESDFCPNCGADMRGAE